MSTRWTRRLIVATLTGALAFTASGYGKSTTAAARSTVITAASLSPSTDLSGSWLFEPEPRWEPTRSQTQTAVPAELVGTWVSTDSGGGELIYRFFPDGRYHHAGVLLQQRPTGLFSYEIAASGTVQVDGSRLVLQPISGTQTLKDPDSATGGWQRPIKKDPETYNWQRGNGDILALTDSKGVTVTYRRG